MINKKTLFSGLIGIWIAGREIVYNSSIEEIFEAQEKLERSKECPPAIIKEETLYNYHDGRHLGNWNTMTFKFDHKKMTTKMYLDGVVQAGWSRILNNDETCSLSINYCQIFEQK